MSYGQLGATVDTAASSYMLACEWFTSGSDSSTALDIAAEQLYASTQANTVPVNNSLTTAYLAAKQQVFICSEGC